MTVPQRQHIWLVENHLEQENSTMQRNLGETKAGIEEEVAIRKESELEMERNKADLQYKNAECQVKLINLILFCLRVAVVYARWFRLKFQAQQNKIVIIFVLPLLSMNFLNTLTSSLLMLYTRKVKPLCLSSGLIASWILYSCFRPRVSKMSPWCQLQSLELFCVARRAHIQAKGTNTDGHPLLFFRLDFYCQIKIFLKWFKCYVQSS